MFTVSTRKLPTKRTVTKTPPTILIKFARKDKKPSRSSARRTSSGVKSYIKVIPGSVLELLEASVDGLMKWRETETMWNKRKVNFTIE